MKFLTIGFLALAAAVFVFPAGAEARQQFGGFGSININNNIPSYQSYPSYPAYNPGNSCGRRCGSSYQYQQPTYYQYPSYSYQSSYYQPMYYQPYSYSYSSSYYSSSNSSWWSW
ncbi:MAG: hypothetical protein JWL87_338 [Candidatus Adlerbacteria bacterium]|nr:hypothetical protein [Candidatus Adlerbacteria bacterium]